MFVVTDGIAIFSHNNNEPEYTDRNGTIGTFGTFASQQKTDNNAGDQWYWMQGAEAPGQDEIILVGLQSSTSTAEGITGEIYNGATWSLIDIPDTGNVLAPGFTVEWAWNLPHCAVAYESLSSNALLVWNDKDEVIQLRYGVWDGTSWTNLTGVPGYVGGETQWIQITSKPGSNEIIVAIGDGDNNVKAGGSTVDYVVIWNGSSFGEVFELAATGSTCAEQTTITVCYESQSGCAMVVYGANGDSKIYYCLWNGVSWSNNPPLDPPTEISGCPQWTNLKPHLNSNKLVLGVQTDEYEVSQNGLHCTYNMHSIAHRKGIFFFWNSRCGLLYGMVICGRQSMTQKQTSPLMMERILQTWPSHLKVKQATLSRCMEIALQ